MEQTSVTPMHRETAADKTRNLTKMALCVAFLAISSYLAFPLPFTPAMVALYAGYGCRDNDYCKYDSIHFKTE